MFMRQKSILFIGGIFLCLLALVCSCSEDNDGLELRAELFGENVLITSNVKINGTRTTMQDDEGNMDLMWQDGDSITLFTKNGTYAYFGSIQRDGSTVVFTAFPGSHKLEAEEGEKVYAVLDKRFIGINVKDNHIIANKDAGNFCYNSKKSVHGLVMYSVGTVKDGKLVLDFKHMFAFLKLTVEKDKMEGKNYLVVFAKNASIYPKATLDFDISSGKFSDDTYKGAYDCVFIPKEVMEAEDDYYTAYLPVFPTEGNMTYHLAAVKENELEINKSLFLIDEPETGIKAGQTFTINTKESIVRSTDKSKDGDDLIMQQASEGDGIKLFFIGRGFTDKDISSGKYDKVMKREMERFFAVEPYKTFRKYFTCYCIYKVDDSNDLAAVTDVTDNFLYDTEAKTAEKYVEKKTSDEVKRIIVVYNGNYVAKSYTKHDLEGSFTTLLMANEKNLVCHEAGGHGFAFLGDENVEFDGNPTDDDKNIIAIYHNDGALANIDYNKEHPVWEKFIKNADYKNEGIGTYEGAYCYSNGVYRPTSNSIMNLYKECDTFNAPSREAIYKVIMKFLGKTYNEEEFYEYDKKNR